MEENKKNFKVNKTVVWILAVLLVVILGLALYINDKVDDLPDIEVLKETNITNESEEVVDVIEEKVNINDTKVVVEENETEINTIINATE